MFPQELLLWAGISWAEWHSGTKAWRWASTACGRRGEKEKARPGVPGQGPTSLVFEAHKGHKWAQAGMARSRWQGLSLGPPQKGQGPCGRHSSHKRDGGLSLSLPLNPPLI